MVQKYQITYVTVAKLLQRCFVRACNLDTSHLKLKETDLSLSTVRLNSTRRKQVFRYEPNNNRDMAHQKFLAFLHFETV